MLSEKWEKKVLSLLLLLHWYLKITEFLPPLNLHPWISIQRVMFMLELKGGAECVLKHGWLVLQAYGREPRECSLGTNWTSQGVVAFSV